MLIIGAGGLGSPVVLYLAGSGIGLSVSLPLPIGHMTIIDGDIVEMSNIHRQIGHTEADAKNKVYKVFFRVVVFH